MIKGYSLNLVENVCQDPVKTFGIFRGIIIQIICPKFKTHIHNLLELAEDYDYWNSSEGRIKSKEKE